ncbi:MAG: class I SAM-dependent methyltransferase [Planctomycetota bacterium]|jgi:SAM-dependent methyltransferase
MSVFDRFAAAFPLVPNEDERWAKEGRLITGLARTAGEGKGRVLDLACGCGFHARRLATSGFAVTAVDLSAAAIEAGRSLPGGERVDWVEGDITRPVAGEYDLVLLVGNTLSLFEEQCRVEGAILTAAGALVPISVTAQTDSGQQVDSGTQRLYEWGAPLLTKSASRAGLALRAEFGGLDGTPRAPGRTKDAVVLYEKREEG